MVSPGPHVDDGRNYVARRIAAFVVDVAFAFFVATLIPVAITEATFGRYHVLGVPGFMLTYCHEEVPAAFSTSIRAEHVRQSPPPGSTYWKTERCTTFRNVILRTSFVQ